MHPPLLLLFLVFLYFIYYFSSLLILLFLIIMIMNMICCSLLFSLQHRLLLYSATTTSTFIFAFSLIQMYISNNSHTLFKSKIWKSETQNQTYSTRWILRNLYWSPSEPLVAYPWRQWRMMLITSIQSTPELQSQRIMNLHPLEIILDIWIIQIR